jgi:hypothetical protein
LSFEVGIGLRLRNIRWRANFQSATVLVWRDAIRRQMQLIFVFHLAGRGEHRSAKYFTTNLSNMFSDQKPRATGPTLEVKGALQIFRSGDYTNREFLIALSCAVLNCQPNNNYGLSPAEMSSVLAAHKSTSKKDISEAVETLVEWCDLNEVRIVDETSSAKPI